MAKYSIDVAGRLCKVDGRRIRGTPFFVHKFHGTWKASQYPTGLALGSPDLPLTGDTAEEARELALAFWKSLTAREQAVVSGASTMLTPKIAAPIARKFIRVLRAHQECKYAARAIARIVKRRRGANHA